MLRARVKTLESENGALATSLRLQETASRTMAEGLQCELARIQHLCNELSYTMVLQGVDPTVLSAVTSKHLLFNPAVRVHLPPLFLAPPPPPRARLYRVPLHATRSRSSSSHVRASCCYLQVHGGGVAAVAPVQPSTPRTVPQKETSSAARSVTAANAPLELPFALAAAPGALPTAAYQLAPVPAPARSGAAQFRGMNAPPPEAFIPDSLRKRLDASADLATRLGSPAMFGTPDASSSAGERVFLTGAPTTLEGAFDAASGGLKPSPPPFSGSGENGDRDDGYDGAPTPPRGNSANGTRRTHSRGRRIVPSPMNGLENTVKEAAVLQ